MSIGFSGVLYVLAGVASFLLIPFFAWMLFKQWKKPPGSPEGIRRAPKR